MQREEKQMDSAMEALLQRLLDLKNAITSFIAKIENEYTTLSWPTVLDNFALISGQISSLNRLLKNEKTPAFRNYVLLPLLLAPERDDDLAKLTEGRVMAFNHEVVPDYLRTKPEPDAEDKLSQLQTKVNNLPSDSNQLQKQINAINKISANLIEMINTTREEADEMSQKAQLLQTSNPVETSALIAAVSFGKNIKPLRKEEPSPSPNTQQPQQSQVNQGYHPQYGYPQGAGGKAPSMIKTNIKSATGSHPYSRN